MDQWLETSIGVPVMVRRAHHERSLEGTHLPSTCSQTPATDNREPPARLQNQAVHHSLASPVPA